jgi:hypothetical protein
MLRIEFACQGFFAIPMKKVEIVADDLDHHFGRTYFVYRGRIVAVARRAA